MLLLVPTAATTVLAAWDFSRSADGWGVDSPVAEAWQRGGALVVRGGDPRTWGVVSPGMDVPVGSDAHVLIRARHLSACGFAAFEFMNGSLAYASQELRSRAWVAAPAWRSAFNVRADGAWRVYAVPLQPPRVLLAGSPAGGGSPTVGALRFLPCVDAGAQHVSVEIDWVRLARAPAIHAVTGCGATLGARPTHSAAQLPAFQPVVRSVPAQLDQWFSTPDEAADPERRAALPAPPSAREPIGATYSCSVLGGDVITVAGSAFGGDGGAALPVVTVAGRPCGSVAWVAAGAALTCVTPPLPPEDAAAAGAAASGGGSPGKRPPVQVAVHNGAMPQLHDAKALLSYAAPPMAPAAAPTAGNVRARAIDVAWAPVPDTWQAMATTGYVVQWRRAAWDNCTRDAACVLTARSGAAANDDAAGDAAWELLSAGDATWVSPAPVVVWSPWPDVRLEESGGDPLAALRTGRHGAGKRAPALAAGWVVTGNVTRTRLWGLEPDTRYQARVAALVESTLSGSSWHSPLDAHGQRRAVPAALLGEFSVPSADVITLPADVIFARFDANATLRHGPAHYAGGEGAFGLALLGSASVANCNATHSCCDGYGGPGFADHVALLDARSHSQLAQARREPASSSAGGAGSWAEIGALPAEIPSVWGSGALRALRTRVAQLGAWRSPLGAETPWFGYDDASDLSVVPPAALERMRVAWLGERDAAGVALGHRLRTFAYNASAGVYDDVSGGSAAAVAAAAATAPPAASAGSRASVAAGDEGALPSGFLVQLELVEAATPEGTTFSYWRQWGRAQQPPVFLDSLGRRVVGGLGGGDDAPAAACRATACGSVQRVAAAPLASPPWRLADPLANTPGDDGARAQPPPASGSSGDGGSSRLTTDPTAPCGPALRLTGAHPSLTGAAWYSRPQAVGGGFDTTFVVRMANPSRGCRTMDGVHTRCVSRGGGGMAFVIQNWHPAALGRGGGDGLGYDGIPLSVAVELDTAADGERRLDPHHSHVSVHVAAPRAPCSSSQQLSADAAAGLAGGARAESPRQHNGAHHTLSLGHAQVAGAPELADGVHAVRVVFDPVFDPLLVAHPAFVAVSPHAAELLAHPLVCGGDGSRDSSRVYDATGADGWAGRAGTGTLSVYVDDLAEPLLIVALNLAAALRLAETHGRAWVGFTASTGEEVWQTHDVLAWELTQDTGDGAELW